MSLTVPPHHPLSTLTTTASASDRPEILPLLLRGSTATLVREWVLGGLGAPSLREGLGAQEAGTATGPAAPASADKALGPRLRG